MERIKAVRRKKACEILSKEFLTPRAKLTDILSLAENKTRTDRLERDPNFLQIIPYSIFRLDKNRINGFRSDKMKKPYPDYKYLVYKRASDNGDTRLRGQWSLGVGGHWKVGEPFSRAVYREVKEETGLKVDVKNIDLNLEGFIKISETPINRVHLGILLFFDMEEDDIITDNFHLNNEIEKYELVTLEELSKYELESWSNYVYEYYLNK